MGPKTLSLPQVVGLIAVVVILVFGVTYASLWLPGLLPSSDGPSKQYVPPELQLKINETGAGPVETKPFLELESGPGHHTFWFVNPNDSPVKLTAVWKKCTCSTIKVATVPPEWNSLKGSELDAREDEPELTWEVIHENEHVMVPPRAVGGIQLHWNKAKPSPVEKFGAILATEVNGQAGKELELKIDVHFVDSVRVAIEGDLRKDIYNEVSVGTLGPGDVAGPIPVVVWSSTRPEFNFAIEDDPMDPCITWGQPEPLAAAAREELGKRDGTKVLCAYRIPVTVRERSEGGKQLDMGPFRRAVSLNVNVVSERIPLRVSGSVRGDVLVGSGDDRDQVGFGTIESGIVRTRHIVLTSGVPDLKLEFDPDAKLPEYLKAKIEEETAPGQFGKSWNLTVTVLSGKVTGPFPRDESVIVLRTNGDPPRKVRIPVTGTVYEKKSGL